MPAKVGCIVDLVLTDQQNNLKVMYLFLKKKFQQLLIRGCYKQVNLFLEYRNAYDALQRAFLNGCDELNKNYGLCLHGRQTGYEWFALATLPMQIPLKGNKINIPVAFSTL